MGKNYFCSLMRTLVSVNPYIQRVCIFALDSTLTRSIPFPSPLSCAALRTRGAKPGQTEALQDLFLSPGLRVVHMWVNLSCLPCPTAAAAPAACYLLTNLMTRGSPGKEKAFSWPHLHRASYVHALWGTPWCLSEAASVLLFGQMGCKSSPLLDTHSALQMGCFLFDYCWCQLSATVLGAVKLGSKWQSLWQRTFSPDFFVV